MVQESESILASSNTFLLLLYSALILKAVGFPKIWGGGAALPSLILLSQKDGHGLDWLGCVRPKQEQPMCPLSCRGTVKQGMGLGRGQWELSGWGLGIQDFLGDCTV